jgi:hypothetical protein
VKVLQEKSVTGGKTNVDSEKAEENGEKGRDWKISWPEGREQAYRYKMEAIRKASKTPFVLACGEAGAWRSDVTPLLNITVDTG